MAKTKNMERKPERTATRLRTVVKKIRCIRCPNEFTQASNYRRHLGLVHGVDVQGEPISSDVRQKYVNYSRKKNVRTSTERNSSQTIDLPAENVGCDQGDTTPLTAESVPNPYIGKRLRLKLPGVRPDQSIIDDKKARECVAALYRYLNLRKEAPTELDVQSNFTTLTPARMRKPPPPTARLHRRRCQPWTLY